MTTLIPKYDVKNGGATPTGAVNRAINLKLAEIVSVKDFGAIGDGTTDDTTAIAAAITYIGSLNGGDIYFPQGTYKVSAPLVLANSQNLVGDTNGATIYNASTTQETITAGTSTTIFNGNKSYITGLKFTGNASGAATCHGINIQGMQVIVRDCTFAGVKGSGIKGQYCQYTRINNCAFYNNGRYGIEILTNNVNTQGSNDIDIADVYQNIGNGLGGIYAQLQQSTIRRCTFTDAATGTYQLYLNGFNNLIEQCTFELANVTGETSVYVYTQNAAPQTFFDCIWSSANTNRAVLIDANSGDVQFSNCTFLYINGTIGNAGYIIKTSIQNNVFVSNCNFTDLLNYAGGTKPVGSTVGPFNVFYETPFKFQRSNLATTGGSGPYYFTYPMVQLPCWGTFQIVIFSGGNGNDYQNQAGINTAIVHYYSGIQAFVNGTASSVGNQSQTQVSSVSNVGLVSIVTSNALSGNQSITCTVTQLGMTN
jgi:uncharacterized protein YjbI with pentapeptide repeats